MNNLKNHNCYTLSRNSNRCDVCGARLPRLIDADALKEKCGDYYAEEVGIEDGFIGTVGQLIDNAPTVEERPKGKWISHYDYCSKHGVLPSSLIAFWWCEQCEQAVEQPSNFCPNCGADMRGDV